jgi:hypothetical protein
VFIQAACTSDSGLGGPPKCASGEAEGTKVDVFPILGSEGSFTRKAEANLKDTLGSIDLKGVFKVVADFKAEEYYPAGDYGIVLAQPGGQQIYVLRVTKDGIVRLDNPVQLPGKEQPDLEQYVNPQP